MKRQSYEKILPSDSLISNIYDIEITDQRDVEEMKRRKAKKTCHPLKDELYSVNPNFDGNYSDPENR